MKYIRTLFLSLISVCLAFSGAVKIIQPVEEVTFYESVGLSTTALLIFGLAHFVSIGLILAPVTRMIGAITATIILFSLTYFTWLSMQSLVACVPAVAGIMALSIAIGARNNRK